MAEGKTRWGGVFRSRNSKSKIAQSRFCLCFVKYHLISQGQDILISIS